MVIVELIGSISLAIALVSVVVLAIVHIKNKQNPTADRHLNGNRQLDYKSSSIALPFEEFNIQKESAIIDVIQNEAIPSSSLIKYGIQWTIPSNEESRTEIVDIPSKENLPNSEFEQGDSVSFSDPSTSVRDLIDKFENNVLKKIYQTEKTNPTDSDLTSIDTNFDNQTIKTDRNQNQQKFSHHSSISNLDVTIPSNLSSSIDLEQFECTSTTSNLSEFLKD